ncbi:MAG: transcriptional regulator, partial [Streptosporangiales bacterium]|nr:transcriptional regulator [Streptosporangiales bacterium]
MPHVLLADLSMGLGENRSATVRHARAALPVMERVGAADDVIQLRSALVMCAVADGRLADAADELALLEDSVLRRASGDLGTFVQRAAHAELLLARGDIASGLRMYRDCAARMRNVRLPGVGPAQMQPWTLVGDAIALSAHARYADGGDDEAHGRELFAECRGHAARVFSDPTVFFDVPAAGLLLFALGSWALRRRAGNADAALRLLALASRFRYNRGIPSMAWEHITPAAEQAAPGRLAGFLAEYQDREPASLLAEADRLARLL